MSYQMLASTASDRAAGVSFDTNFASSATMFVSLEPRTPGYRTLVRSTDGGMTFGQAGIVGWPPTGGLSAINMLPDGHLLVGLIGTDAQGDAGIRCSGDAGQTWRQNCW